MEQINFSEFKAPEVSNKRRGDALPPKVQEYDNIKYRRSVSKKGGEESISSLFFVSKKAWNEMSLDTLAGRHFVHPTRKDIVLIGAVADKDGKFLKQRKNKEKGTNFKSESLEAALSASGVIDTSDAALGTNQFIDIKEVATNQTIDGIKVEKVFVLSKGQGKTKEEKAAAVEAKVEARAAANTEAPKAEPAPAAAPAATEEDWS